MKKLAWIAALGLIALSSTASAQLPEGVFTVRGAPIVKLPTGR